MHGNPAQLPLGVGPAGQGEHLLRILVLLLAGAEHILLVPGVIALGEALAGEGLFQGNHLLLGGLALLLDGLGIDFGDDGGILRPLHAPLDLHAGHPCLLQLLQPVHQAVVLEGHGIVVHAAAQAVLHPAGLGAHTPVAAAAADEAGHIALPGMAEAEGAVDENLRLNGGVLGNELDLLEAQLPGQYRPGQAHFGGGLHPGQVMYAHLGAGMDGQIRQRLPDGPHQAQILHDDPVRPAAGGQPGSGHGGFHLPVCHQGVQGHIDLAAPDAAVAHGLFKIFLTEVLGAPAGVEVPQAHIYGVRPVLHGGNHCLRRPGGRKQFQHCSISPKPRGTGPSPPLSHFSLILAMILA